MNHTTSSMTEQAVETAAELLARNRLMRTPFEGFPPALETGNIEDAFRVQEALHASLVAAGCGTVIGEKIGCTTSTMQAYLRIESPTSGGIFATSVHADGGEVAHDHFVRPGVECEIAIRLGHELGPNHAGRPPEELASLIDTVMAAIELVDDRYRDWTTLSVATLTADDFFGAGCVLGAEQRFVAARELRSAHARMTINGAEVGSGVGTDILGDPLEALAWMARSCARRGRTLPAGSLIMLGSLVQTQWVQPGDVVAVENNPLGQVSIAFG